MMGYKSEKEAIMDVTSGGRCYYLTVRLLIHPLSMRLVYLANKLKLHPNYLSLVCAIFSFLCLLDFYLQHFSRAFLFFYIRTVLDYTDGALARYSSRVSKSGKLLDRFIDEFFYLPLWILIALKTGSFIIGAYFMISVLSYRLIVDLYIEPRLHLIGSHRATIKQFFINHGIILGFGVFTLLEFWVLFMFSVRIPANYIIIPAFFSNLDLAYRTYEIMRYAKSGARPEGNNAESKG